MEKPLCSVGSLILGLLSPAASDSRSLPASHLDYDHTPEVARKRSSTMPFPGIASCAEADGSAQTHPNSTL
jgi:hypothetical protein